jgi:hypothetical protein
MCTWILNAALQCLKMIEETEHVLCTVGLNTFIVFDGNV